MPDPTGSLQPYQKRLLAAIECGGRLETFSERWIRERIESRRAFAEAVERTNAVASAQAAIASFEPIARQILEAERGAPLGRKRRARRARGRRRHA